MNERNQYNYKNIPEEDAIINIDFKKLISDVLHYWWVFVLSICAALAAAFLYNRYTDSVYSSSISLIVDEQSTRNFNSQSMSLVDGFMLSPGMMNIDNQIAILGSRTMVRRVVEKMDVCVSYFNKGRIRMGEMYKSCPFDIVMDSTHCQPLEIPMLITIVDSTTYNLEIDTDKPVQLYNYKKTASDGSLPSLSFSGRFKFGEPIVTPWCAFSVVRNGWMNEESTYMARFNNFEAIVDYYTQVLQITRDDETKSSVVGLSVVGTCVAKNNDFLNLLANEFVQDNLHQKNMVAKNTIRFIESQLSQISDTLLDIGTKLSSFKAVHGIQNDVSTRGTELSADFQTYEKELQSQRLILSYYDYLNNYFSSDSILSGVIAPAFFDTKSSAIAEQLNQIMELNIEKQSYQDTYGKPTNPASREVLAKLHIARNTLLRSIQNHRQMIETSIADLEAKRNECWAELMSLPETERLLLGIDRKFSINNEVYSYLLRKRSESQIQEASNTSDHKIIDPARMVAQIAPNTRNNTMLGVVLAIVLPLAFFVVRQIFDNKLRTIEDIRKQTQYSIVGEITNNTKESPLVVSKYPKSLIADKFRRMRTSVDFMTAEAETPVVTISSSVSGEGKTFSAVNTASVFAISGKKTILIGLDLRKPGMAQLINQKHDLGVSDYLAGHCTLEEAVFRFDDNLDIIMAGTIPPNPAELIITHKCTEMIEIFKKNYDVVVVDTPPMGLVADTYQILNFTDVLLFVVRLDYSMKNIFKHTIDSLSSGQVKNVGIIVNDIEGKHSRYGYGSYGYGYGRYGYGKYGYGKYGYGKYGYGYGQGKHSKSNGYYTD